MTTAARTPVRQEVATRLAWSCAIQGWRGTHGVIKPAGEPLRAAAQAYLAARIGGWPKERPWPDAVRELPAAALQEWRRLTDRGWPVELRVVGVVVFGFHGPGEGTQGALQC